MILCIPGRPILPSYFNQSEVEVYLPPRRMTQLDSHAVSIGSESAVLAKKKERGPHW